MLKKIKNIVFLISLFSILLMFPRPGFCPPPHFPITLQKGQNFISLPLIPPDAFIQQALYSIEGKYSNIWFYDNADPSDVWKHYHPEFSIGFSDLQNIEPGKGYWVEVGSDCTLAAEGVPIDTNFPLNLRKGWNSFGWPYADSQGVENALYELASGTDYSRICRFNGGNKSFENYSSGFTTFDAGRAYYIYALRDCSSEILPLPVIEITQPEADSLQNTAEISVSGILSQQNMTVEVNSIPAVVSNLEFSADITLSEGENTITAVGTNPAGNTASDSINVILDTTAPPAPTLNPVNSPTNQNQQFLSGGKETNTSLYINGEERIALDISTYWNTEVSLSEGSNTFNITARDTVENESAPAVANILFDSIPPTGSLKINDDSQYTNSKEVTLSVSAEDNTGGSGVEKMQFSNDNVNWSSPQDYTATKTWTLTDGEGEKGVYVKFKDTAGNLSSAYSDSIILDTVPPAVIISSPEPGAIIEESEVTLKGTIDGVSFSEVRTFSIDGENTLTKTAQDEAGNEGSASVTVYYEPGTLIGSAGGEASSKDGKIKIIVPAGALSEPTYIKLLSVNKESLQDALPGKKVLLSLVECKPYGLNFNKPVELIYRLDEAEVPGTSVELGLYNAVTDEIELTGKTSIVAADGYIVSFSITHFSTYAALKALLPTGGSFIGSGVQIPLPDMFTGAFSHSVPITVPPGRKGIQPNLGITYRSSNSNSWVGMGFGLNPGYIVRSTRVGPPSYIDTKDTFHFVTDGGSTELVHLIDNLYQAKVESNFAKFYKEEDVWRVLQKDGTTLYFGQTDESREGSDKGTFSWQLTRVIDTNRNYVQYDYTKDRGKCYLASVDYTGNEDAAFTPTHRLEFLLEPRKDIFSNYLSGGKIATAQRLKQIEVKIKGEVVWRYELEYAYSERTDRSLLKSIIQYTADGKAFPAQTFGYQ